MQSSKLRVHIGDVVILDDIALMHISVINAR